MMLKNLFSSKLINFIKHANKKIGAIKLFILKSLAAGFFLYAIGYPFHVNAQAPLIVSAAQTSDGRVEIKFSDGDSTIAPTVANQKSVEDIKISFDKSTIAWINLVDTNGSSSAPVAMTIYRNQKFSNYEPGLGIFDWYFVNKGRWIVTVQGPLRGELTPIIVLTDSLSAEEVSSWEYGTPKRPSWVIPNKLKTFFNKN